MKIIIKYLYDMYFPPQSLFSPVFESKSRRTLSELSGDLLDPGETIINSLTSAT